LPTFLEEVHVRTRRQLYYQDDGVPSFIRVDWQYLNRNFPNDGAKELATIVTGLQPVVLQNQGLRETCRVRTKIEHKKKSEKFGVKWSAVK